MSDGHVAVLPLFFIAIPQPSAIAKPEGIESKLGILSSDVKAGIRYVWHWPGLRSAVVRRLCIFYYVTNGIPRPHPDSQLFQARGQGTGIYAIGDGDWHAAGRYGASIWGGTRKKVYTVAGGLIGIAIGTIVIGVTPGWLFGLAVVGAFIAGMMVSVANAPLTAIMQSSVDPRIQGRVLTVFNSTISVISPLGLAIAGPISDLFGVHLWYLIAGLLCLVMGVMAFFLKSVQNVEAEGQRHMEQMASIDFVPVTRTGEKDDISY